MSKRILVHAHKNIFCDNAGIRCILAWLPEDRQLAVLTQTFLLHHANLSHNIDNNPTQALLFYQDCQSAEGMSPYGLIDRPVYGRSLLSGYCELIDFHPGTAEYNSYYCFCVFHVLISVLSNACFLFWAWKLLLQAEVFLYSHLLIILLKVLVIELS